MNSSTSSPLRRSCAPGTLWAKAVVRCCRERRAALAADQLIPDQQQFRMIPGRGVQALIEGLSVLAGNRGCWEEKRKTIIPPQASGRLSSCAAKPSSSPRLTAALPGYSPCPTSCVGERRRNHPLAQTNGRHPCSADRRPRKCRPPGGKGPADRSGARRLPTRGRSTGSTTASGKAARSA